MGKPLADPELMKMLQCIASHHKFLCERVKELELVVADLRTRFSVHMQHPPRAKKAK